MKRLLALTESRDSVFFRYRIEAFRQELAARGWQLEAVARPRSLRQLGHQLAQVASADAVIYQRRWPGLIGRRMLRRAARLLILDIDPHLLHAIAARGPLRRAIQRRRMLRMMGIADACITGTSQLEQLAWLTGGGGGIHMIPTCVDQRLYSMAAHDRAAGEAHLVWLGGPASLGSLHGAHDGLIAASSRLPKLRLKLLGHQFPRLHSLRVIPTSWSAETEAAELAGADVGIAYLPGESELGSCALEAMQFMAAGLPVVANPVFAHRELVSHGETGFLAATPQQWADALQQLAGDPALRAQMGQAGRARLTELFSVQAWAERFAMVVESLSAPAPRRTESARAA